MHASDAVLEHIDAHLNASLDRLLALVSLHETTGNPVVIEKYAKPGQPSHTSHILFYGHYDVQPADPVELWHSPPFEPEIRKGKDGKSQIFGRGASDDKGQFMTFVEACRADKVDITAQSRKYGAKHSPNEKYDVESFHKGMRSRARIFAELN